MERSSRVREFVEQDPSVLNTGRILGLKNLKRRQEDRLLLQESEHSWRQAVVEKGAMLRFGADGQVGFEW